MDKKQLEDNQKLYDKIHQRMNRCKHITDTLGGMLDFKVKAVEIKGTVREYPSVQYPPIESFSELKKRFLMESDKFLSPDTYNVFLLSLSQLTKSTDRIMCHLYRKAHFDTLTKAFDLIEAKEFLRR